SSAPLAVAAVPAATSHWWPSDGGGVTPLADGGLETRRTSRLESLRYVGAEAVGGNWLHNPARGLHPAQATCVGCRAGHAEPHCYGEAELAGRSPAPQTNGDEP
ncbi:MAG: hypothetical protein RMJ82_15750, partial [Gemmatales bacterium]|nr:hypothetical protein [Gemmatales bacterium]